MRSRHSRMRVLSAGSELGRGLRGEDRHFRRLSSNRGQLTYEFSRRGHCEVLVQGAHVTPVLEEDEAVVVFDVTVHRVEEAPRLLPRPAHVLKTHLDRTVECIGSDADASGDDDHEAALYGPRS